VRSEGAGAHNPGAIKSRGPLPPTVTPARATPGGVCKGMCPFFTGIRPSRLPSESDSESCSVSGPQSVFQVGLLRGATERIPFSHGDSGAGVTVTVTVPDPDPGLDAGLGAPCTNHVTPGAGVARDGSSHGSNDKNQSGIARRTPSRHWHSVRVPAASQPGRGMAPQLAGL
jgi:hypothetical protein